MIVDRGLLFESIYNAVDVSDFFSYFEEFFELI